MEDTENSMVVLAIFVSRFEAIAVASMLRAYNIYSVIDGEAHASVEYFSMALGGHRLAVMQCDYQSASDLVRQTELTDRDYALSKPGKPLLAMVGLIAGAYSALIIPSVLFGNWPIYSLIQIPMAVYSVPIDPKGKADYFLSEVS